MKYHFDIPGDDFSAAGIASYEIKKAFKAIGIPTNIVKRVAIAMYEAELNMVVHADGGTIDIELTDNEIIIIAKDNGPGISDVHKAMLEGYSTANNVYIELGFGAGMGLSNIMKNTDSFEIKSLPEQGTTLKMSISYDR